MSSIERPSLNERLERPRARTEHDDVGLDARIESYDDEDLCTIHPQDADEETLVTTWISARGDAFVDLDDMR